MGSCPVCKLTLLAIKHKEEYNANRKKIAEDQLDMISSSLEKQNLIDPSISIKTRPMAELETRQLWNTPKSYKQACMGHVHSRKMQLAYKEMLKLEKKERKMRNSNYFSENWGQADSYVR